MLAQTAGWSEDEWDAQAGVHDDEEDSMSIRQQLLVPHWPVDIPWLLNDKFTDTRAAGALIGTDPTPGPGGPRGGQDTNNALSTSGGRLIKGAILGPGASDPVLTYAAQARVAGSILTARMTGAAGLEGSRFGWASSATTYPNQPALYWHNVTGALQALYNATTVNVATFTSNGDYHVALVMRAAGAFYFVYGTEFSTIRLLGWNAVGTATPLYPAFGGFVAAATYAADYIHLSPPGWGWMPTPLISDGFSAAASDGLGHAEGIAGGLGVGGSGKSWTASVGTWQVAAGVASATALDGGIAIRTADLGVADAIFECGLTRSAGNVGIVLRYIDAANYLYAYHDGTNATLRQVLGGVDTELIAATAAAYGAGRVLRCSAIGNEARLYYGTAPAAIGAAVAIDAGLAAATRAGLFTSDLGNTFDNALAYASGTGGEYISLMRFF